MTTHTTPTGGTTVSINSSTWNAALRYDQAQLRPAPTQLLTIAGQGPMSHDGTLQHQDDTAAQLGAAIDNVTELLELGDATWADVHRLTIYTTDLDGVLAAYDRLTVTLDRADATPPCTLVGVARLAVPGMTVEVEVTAGR